MTTTKIAYNGCFGGFSLSRAAILRAREISSNQNWGGACIKGDVGCDRDYGYIDVKRTDPVLIQVIEELGELANGSCAKLRIAQIAKGTLYRIDEYDGNESIDTRDSYDWKVA